MSINSINGNTLLTSGSFPPVRAASTGSPLAPTTGGLLTVDGIALIAGDRVLCKDETSAVNNGIYAASTGPWVRTSDAAGNQNFFSGMAVTVALGATNGGKTFLCTTTDDPVVVGTSNIIFAAQSVIIAAGVGINAGLINQLAFYGATGSILSGFATANNGVLVTSAGGVPSISSTLPIAVQGNITQVGTVGSGTWNGTVVGATYGGTGVNNGSKTITLAGNLTIATFGGTIAFGLASKTLTIDNSLEFAGTDSTKFTFPGTTDTVVTLTATQTLTNKTLTAPVIATITNTGTLTLPTSTDTLIGRATTDTLTNKTFDTAGTGNVLKLNGTQVVSIGTGLAAASNALLIDPSYMRGYLGGLTLSGGGSQTLTINAGVACSDDFTTLMKLGSNYTKTFAAWAVGSGNGGLDTGSIANNTWYHVYIIERPDTGVVDVLISTNATTPTLPANYTKQRRIGSIKTDAGPNIIAFIQDDDQFMWKTPVADVSATNPGTSAVTRTLASTPLGVRVKAVLGVGAAATVQTDMPASIYLTDLSLNDLVPGLGSGAFTNDVFATAANTNSQQGSMAYIMTNTSQQIRSRIAVSGASTVLTISTQGWVDTRGRFT